jgi:hypothetical protein
MEVAELCFGNTHGINLASQSAQMCSRVVGLPPQKMQYLDVQAMTLIEFAPFGFAAVKALVCAKFVSVGHALHIGERFKSLPLIWPTRTSQALFSLCCSL